VNEEADRLSDVGMCLLNEARLGAALEALNRSLALDPGKANAWLRRCRARAADFRASVDSIPREVLAYACARTPGGDQADPRSVLRRMLELSRGVRRSQYELRVWMA
jgi:hypothetical protein